jgi:hypothetical protein
VEYEFLISKNLNKYEERNIVHKTVQGDEFGSFNVRSIFIVLISDFCCKTYCAS